MSIHASRVKKTISIPFDAPHEATIQKLPGRWLAKAADAHQAEVVRGIGERGGAAVVKELQKVFGAVEAGDGDAKQTIAQISADPLNGYDKHQIIRGGLKSWTYTDVPVTQESIEDLDDEAVDFFATEIMRLTKPALFQTDEEQEADTKNG